MSYRTRTATRPQQAQRIHKRYVFAILFTLVLLAASAPLSAQGGNRYREVIERSKTIEGLTASQTAAWTKVVDDVAGVLRAMPGVTRPPSGICTLLSGHTGSYVLDGRMQTAVTVQIPPSWDETRGCAKVSNGAVTVHINGTGRFIARLVADLDWNKLRVTPAFVGTRGGATLWQDPYDRWAVITHGRAPLLDTLTVEEYIRSRSAELREQGAVDLGNQLTQRLKGMSQADRSAPACFGRDDLVGTLGPCGPRVGAHVRLNRDYFDRTLPPNAVQLIVVSSPQEVRGKEDPRHYELRTQMYESVDLEALARLIHR